MKVNLDTELFAVVNTKTNELVPRYTGGFFWTRRGDAERKFDEMLRKASHYSLMVCKLNVTEMLSGPQIMEERRIAVEKAAEIARQKREAEQLRNQRIEELKNELKELTGQRELDIPTIKTFLVSNLIVPDYKVKIENVLNELSTLNYSKVR